MYAKGYVHVSYLFTALLWLRRLRRGLLLVGRVCCNNKNDQGRRSGALTLLIRLLFALFLAVELLGGANLALVHRFLGFLLHL